jgi:hypothetical protein
MLAWLRGAVLSVLSYVALVGAWVYGPALPLLWSRPLHGLVFSRAALIFGVICIVMAAGLIAYSVWCGARAKTWLKANPAPPLSAAIIAAVVVLCLAFFTAEGRRLVGLLQPQDNIGSQALVVYETAWLLAIAYLAKLFWDNAVESLQRARAPETERAS